MKILYSAFECNPSIGSDAYVGWSWAKQISQMHETHVLTSANNKDAIEQWKQKYDLKAEFHYISLPKGLRVLLKGRFGYFTSYLLWQWYAYRYARSLHKKVHFDIVHHISIADFRVIGLLWKLGVPYIFGPVGGGQETPESLQEYIAKYKKKEIVRSFLNKFALSMHLYKKGIQHASAVFVSNDETIALMQKFLGTERKLTQMCELGIDSETLHKRADLVHEKRETVHLLVSGRLMYRKGIELLLDACQSIHTDVPFVIDVYGSGHQQEDVKQQIRDRKLENRVILHGKVPFAEMPGIYESADIFVLPSLRETTGTAVVEAMSSKLPVVALNQNGVKYLVGDQAGLLVDIGNKQETVERFAKALQKLIEDYPLRVKLGNQGFAVLQSKYTWEAKAKEMLDIYNAILE